MTTLRPELRDDELVDIPGMDLEGLVKDAADAAAGDVMEGIETLNSGPPAPARKVQSPRAAPIPLRGRPVAEMSAMELRLRDTFAHRAELRRDRALRRAFPCATATGYVAGFFTLLVMVPLGLLWSLFLAAYRRVPRPRKDAKVAPASTRKSIYAKPESKKRRDPTLAGVVASANAAPKKVKKTAGDARRAKFATLDAKRKKPSDARRSADRKAKALADDAKSRKAARKYAAPD